MIYPGRVRPLQTPQSAPELFVPLARYGSPIAWVPDVLDWGAASRPAQRDPLMNDIVADCTVAACLHLSMAWTANAGESVIWSGADALRLYRSWAGYDGSQASDIGADELSILLHWQENGLDEQGGHTIAAWLAVDGTSVLDVKRGIYLCEGLYFVCELASDWQYGTHDGATWSKATGNPRLGHAMALLGYDAKGVYLNSGGCRILMLWDAFVQAAARPNGGGVYAALSTDVINRASRRAPNGLDFEAMRADFDALRSA